MPGLGCSSSPTAAATGGNQLPSWAPRPVTTACKFMVIHSRPGRSRISTLFPIPGLSCPNPGSSGLKNSSLEVNNQSCTWPQQPYKIINSWHFYHSVVFGYYYIVLLIRLRTCVQSPLVNSPPLSRQPPPLALATPGVLTNVLPPVKLNPV